MSGHAKMHPASYQVSATSLKLLIQQIHPHVRVERDSGMCVESLRNRSAAALERGVGRVRWRGRVLMRCASIRAAGFFSHFVSSPFIKSWIRIFWCSSSKKTTILVWPCLWRRACPCGNDVAKKFASLSVPRGATWEMTEASSFSISL